MTSAIRSLSPKLLNDSLKTNSAPQSGFKTVKQQMTLLQAVQNYAAQWHQAGRATMHAVRNLPPQSRALVELQLLTNRLHAETEVATRMGEAAASTLKRLQQSGSN